MTLGERLSEYRTNAKMSQDALAEKIGVTRQTISKWETDQSTPEFNKILPLCEIFRITPDELIKGEKSEKTSDIMSGSNDLYNEKRNKRKALVVSISVFLYCIGIFGLPYMVETLKYTDSHAIMISTTLWSIATVMLIYFFISHPKREAQYTLKKEENLEKELDVNKRIKVIGVKNKTEVRVIELIALIFLLSYLIISFVTMAWHITWILWIVFAIVEVITKLIFDLRR